ncbi:MAG: right-handed parallel beta-helix repeat-containing protein, partial [Planctomycetaceae bacterium]|nr:right-handed parallel beta-helix repeat-containing protein [Planctomycetaceae bacterium]
TLDNTTATTLQLDRIDASNNNGDGLKLSLLGGAVIPATSIDVGTFNNNGANGIGLILTDSTASIDITNSTFDLLGTIASASNNGASGLLVLLDNADLTMDTVDQIIFDNNGGTGITIQGATPSTFTSGSSFTNNTITNNGSFGFRGIFNGGNFDISLGSRTTPGEGNLFDNNTGAGVLLEMLQDSTGRMAIIDNTITNTNAGAGAFLGDGIFVRMLGTANPAQATNKLIDLTVPGVTPGLLIRDNTIGGTGAGNDGTGINFEVKEKSTLDGVDILNNSSNNNGIDGLNYKRFDQVTVNRFVASGNSFNGNGDDGVEIIAQNDGTPSIGAMDLTLTGNTMNANENDGTVLGVNADAKLHVNVNSNTMSNNLDDGLDLVEVALSVTDDRAIFGTISDNNISNNTKFGIGAGAFMGLSAATPLTFSDNTIGAELDQFGQVVIDGNGSTGIFYTGGGDSVWTNNDIIRNGRLQVADPTVGHGIDIEDDFFGFYEKHITLDSNRIRENFQDGIEIKNDGTSSDPNFAFFQDTPYFIEMIDNRVQDNLGRGVDILNQLVSTTFVTMRSSNPADPMKGNFINSNGEEGVYAVNTPSATQTQDVSAATPLMMDGSVVIGSPNLSLTIDSSTVSNNGAAGNVAGMVQSGGIVVRVGSAGQGNTFGNSSTDFATSLGPNTGFIPPVVVSAPVIPTFVRPGAYLQVTNSTMQGNFGDDAFLHGFTATPDPTGITGTWSAMMFAPMGGQGDPLARLDVVWGTAAAGNDNTFDSIEVNNQFGIGIPSTPNGEPGAFYKNADGTFKSRLSNTMPAGPFSTGGPGAGRARNAQRVAERVYPDGSFLAPDPGTSPDGGSFLYPGVGDSTFRAYAYNDAAVGAEMVADGFIFDRDPANGDFGPIQNFNEINFGGTYNSSANPFGFPSAPYAWGTY